MSTGKEIFTQKKLEYRLYCKFVPNTYCLKLLKNNKAFYQQKYLGIKSRYQRH